MNLPAAIAPLGQGAIRGGGCRHRLTFRREYYRRRRGMKSRCGGNDDFFGFSGETLILKLVRSGSPDLYPSRIWDAPQYIGLYAVAAARHWNTD
ncbi:hypothetical protein KDX01_13210 [Burkholderia vietnamiensis]|uniref:hypothetical protein n=1 Tax=Burkholderia vietnamiensis TaxID=60552 RepID=UPI001BA2147C|nr:hypothetical protein [Burkholderia vietnamiensis]MBR7974054.1 hypothetical protein [Burkholderia vietnamiensis]